jgi:hypothetical protein
MPLHAAGYYLNPEMHYSPTFKADFEVKEGMYECLKRMVGNRDERIKIDAQLEEFKSKAGMFGGELATLHLRPKLRHNGGNRMVIHVRSCKGLLFEY